MLNLLLRFWPLWLLLLVTAIYLLRRRRAMHESTALSPLERKAWMIALAVAFGLTFLSFLSLIFSQESNVGTRYEPARLEDGKLIRGKQVQPKQ